MQINDAAAAAIFRISKRDLNYELLSRLKSRLSRMLISFLGQNRRVRLHETARGTKETTLHGTLAQAYAYVGSGRRNG